MIWVSGRGIEIAVTLLDAVAVAFLHENIDNFSRRGIRTTRPTIAIHACKDYPAARAGSTTAIKPAISSSPSTPIAVTYLAPTFQVTANCSGICTH